MARPAGALLAAGLCAAAAPPRWGSPADPPEERAAKVLAQMTQHEKVSMIHGSSYLVSDYVGHVPGNDRLGIPPILMNDGPQGFRAQKAPGTSTQFPCGLAIGATWNQSAARAWGDAMGQEFFAKGAGVQLGPGVNVARVPVNGRNFEYLSGEDPHLGAAIVGPVIKAIQGRGVIANVKHYIGNNQETDRMRVNALIDERTRMEIYQPPFEAAVDAGVLSVMCSYNLVNGHHACENNVTLMEELKGRFGFRGWVMSDWTATKSTVAAANSGLDQEMPTGIFFNELSIDAAVARSQVPQRVIDGMVQRILTGMFAGGLFDVKPSGGNARTNVTSAAHRALARELARDGAVLLKNKGTLPLRADGRHHVAVIGKHAAPQDLISGGGGSGAVKPSHAVSVLEAAQRRFGADRVVYNDGSDQAAAVRAAAAADCAIVVLADTSSEGEDRKGLALPDAELAKAVGAAQANTVALAIAPGAVLTDWADSVGAAILMFFPGEQEGEAALDIMLGAEPGGRLPLTMPNKENEVGFTPEQYPGVKLTANYSERLEIGYRWYTARGVQPAFPFGFGLSYATFAYSGLSASATEVSCVVKNTAAVPGIETPQLYLAFPESAGEPPLQLKGFSKLSLGPGEERRVTFPLGARDVSVWDVDQHQWRKVRGTFGARVGPNSASLPLSGRFTV
eukprot:TRINITY_DN5578_c0_g1_i4.p1 TRINITY_DN5578_c0_g1~~TRINITY_DN5578_c0_g1_i4.p1  ORF type:complete len:701 (+),score=203.29 TRINITY_DN5578_c0_g1_i4:72-2105(+)